MLKLLQVKMMESKMMNTAIEYGFITHRYLTIILAPVILHGKNHIAVIIVLETINSICERSACN